MSVEGDQIRTKLLKSERQPKTSANFVISSVFQSFTLLTSSPLFTLTTLLTELSSD